MLGLYKAFTAVSRDNTPRKFKTLTPHTSVVFGFKTPVHPATLCINRVFKKIIGDILRRVAFTSATTEVLGFSLILYADGLNASPIIYFYNIYYERGQYVK